MQSRLINFAHLPLPSSPRRTLLPASRLASLLALVSLLGACASSTETDPTGRGRDTGTSVMDSGTRDDGGPIDSGSTPPRDSGRDTTIIGPSCGSITCEALERCVDGACAPYPACVADTECAATEICRNRFCLPRSADIDGDGVSAETDCDETNAFRYPGATETCDTLDEDCDDAVDEDVTRMCATACGAGTERCEGGAFVGCDAPPVGTESCNGVDDDCDGTTDEGLTRACSTACGAGDETCSAGSWVMCDAPPTSVESCNLVDDDCDGSCDEGASCRIAVHRSLASSTGEHFYSTSRTEVACCGFTVEHYDFFHLYSSSKPGLVPFYRCLLASGFHFYTQSAVCEGSAGATLELTVGYIARSASVCGSTPLYRLRKGADHFYTPSIAERDSAVSVFGYVYESIAGYVWATP